MKRMASRLALFVALVLWGANVAWASDIACPTTFRGRCDVSAPAGTACQDTARIHPHGRQLICEYAMLHESYEAIYADQQRGRHAGTVSRAELDAWRRKRDACTTVRCLDQLFANWHSGRRGPALRDAPARPPTLADTRPAPRRAMPAPHPATVHGDAVVTPAVDTDADLAMIDLAASASDPATPSFEPATLSLRDSLPPLPPRGPRPDRPGPASAFTWMAWVLVLLAAGGAFYWLVIRKQASRYLDAAFASAASGLSWLKTLPMLAFILTGLALLNGALLVFLLGGWRPHVPGIN